MMWIELKEAIEAAGATDLTEIQSIREINPGTAIDELYIDCGDSTGITVD